MKALDPIAVELAGTTLIEASAGTGKTYTIATLFLRLLLERRLDVSQILVVTYTRAATAELRDRIRRRLVEAVAALDAPSADDNLRALFEARARRGTLAADRAVLMQALRDFDQAAIFTIHAFCQQTLGESAFESRTPFELALSEDQTPLLREVVLDYWVQTVCSADRELIAALRKHSDPKKLSQLAGKAVRDPLMPVLPELAAAELPPIAEFRAARARAAELWTAQRAALLDRLCGPPPLLGRGYPAEKIRGECASELDRLADAGPLELPKFLTKLPRALGGAPEQAFFAAAGALLAAAAALNQAIDRRVLAVRRKLVDYARGEVERRLREQGVHSFDDLLHSLGAALRGPAGAALAQRVRERHPAALIDEFQDTDPVQYAIFRRIYGDGPLVDWWHRAGASRRRDVDDGAGFAEIAPVLFLIGDPKQAIYGFRGADVFAYMQAANLAGPSVYTLDVSYRSDPGLLAAMAALFGRVERPFLFREIQFERVRPQSDARERLTPEAAALQLLFVPRDARTNGNDRKQITKTWGEEQLPRLCAYEVVHLLHSGAQIDGKPLKPRHIAVLCRTNAQAKDTQLALSALGVPTVLEGDSSVFDSESAEELSRVLWAVAEPGDQRKLGAALASSILGVEGAALQRMRGDEGELEAWLDRFARWNQLWHERGFVQMMHRLLDDAGVQARLLARSNGERRLTDLLHLVELLHVAAAQQHLGPLSLLHWFAQMRADPDARAGIVADSQQMRLEHDEHAVRLTTVHRSKGLEYPVVFCPFLWTRSLARDPQELRFHDRADHDRVKLDLGSDAWDAHKRAADREELAENLRVLYVALTRAKHRCYAIWGRFYGSGTSALGYLLHPSRDAADADPNDLERRLDRSDAELRADLDALGAASEGSVGVREIRFDPPTPYAAAERARGELAARTAQRTHAPWPRMTSFSRLAASAASESAPAEADAPDHDATAPEAFAPEQPVAAAAARVVLHDFPSGARPGSLIHAVYEHVDFQRNDPAELPAQAERFLTLFGVEAARHREALVHGIAHSLLTPLDRGAPPLTLARIARADRVDELEFTLCTGRTPAALAAGRLAAAFARHGAPACDPTYAERLRALGFIAAAEFVKGFIDLVFRHDGRFYLADYKSNWLGDCAADYRLAPMVGSMREHHYFLQYHLYVVALHRWLALRVPDYDYERHFGGVYYLYVRGMSPEHESGTGVFFDRPKRALIEELAAALGVVEVPA